MAIRQRDHGVSKPTGNALGPLIPTNRPGAQLQHATEPLLSPPQQGPEPLELRPGHVQSRLSLIAVLGVILAALFLLLRYGGLLAVETLGFP